MLNNTGKRIGCAIAALAAIAFSTYFSSSISRQDGIADLGHEAAYHLDLLRANLFAPTVKFSYLPEVIANHSTTLDALTHASDPAYLARANQFLGQTNSTAKSAVIYVLDRSGLVIAASNWQEPDSFVGQNYAFRPYFQDAIASRTGRFYGMGTTSMRPGYYLSHPVRSENKVIGVAVVKIDMSDLDQGWNWTRDEVTVADGNGVIFLSSRPEWKYRPMEKLTQEASKQLQRTRQYDKVLMPSLPMTVLQQLQSGERVVEVGPSDANDNLARARYLLKSGKLPGSDWTIHVFAPMRQVDLMVRRVALITAGALALLALALLYLYQMLDRAREREKSRKALEEAHQALEHKHLELQKLSEELRIASITDPLTGACNRRFFFATIPRLVSASVRHGSPLSFVAIDVDHFKRINDMYGHPVGDKVLQMLTGLCKDSLREADVFARFGGEEFMMALPDTSAEEARLVADRLRLLLMNHPMDIRGESLVIRISCGVSQCLPGEDDAEAVLKRADDALYIAKSNGRNQVVVR